MVILGTATGNTGFPSLHNETGGATRGFRRVFATLPNPGLGPVPPKPDAVLEKATLEELNLALGLAFAHISSRRAW